MKLVTSEDMRRIDAWAIEKVGIPGPVLMENAGLCVIEVVGRIFRGFQGLRVAVLCGRGNNGGDGLVVARHLLNRGAVVKTFLIGGKTGLSEDAALNLKALEGMGASAESIRAEDVPAGIEAFLERLRECDLIVDAILGTGFKGEVREPAAAVIRAANGSNVPILAVDVPSGLDATSGRPATSCIKARWTVTFEYPKVGLVIYPGAEYAGTVFVGDISIPAGAPDGNDLETIDPPQVKAWLPPRPPDSHKGTYGRVLVVAGSRGLMGAATMAGMSALRGGAGLVTVGVPASLVPAMEARVMEVMKLGLPEDSNGVLSAEASARILEFCEKADVLAFGPGISVSGDTRRLAASLVAGVEVPMVIDADGLNCLDGLDSLQGRPGPTVITPHPGEMARLMGMTTAEVQADRIRVARQAAERSGAVVVLKGARTVIALPGGKCYVNLTGNPGMATGGMGDVLTGVIAAMIAQRLSVDRAAAVGVFLHGLAGDMVAFGLGNAGLVAGDVMNALPVARRWVEEEGGLRTVAAADPEACLSHGGILTRPLCIDDMATGIYNVRWRKRCQSIRKDTT